MHNQFVEGSLMVTIINNPNVKLALSFIVVLVCIVLGNAIA